MARGVNLFLPERNPKLGNRERIIEAVEPRRFSLEEIFVDLVKKKKAV